VRNYFLSLPDGYTLQINAPNNVIGLLLNSLPITSSLPFGGKSLVRLVWKQEVYIDFKKAYWNENYGVDEIVWNTNQGEWFFLGCGFGFFFDSNSNNYSFYIESYRLEEVLTFTYPLLNFLVFLLDQLHYSPIHAAVIGLNDKFVLLPGKRFAGKSTTTATWALFGGNVVSDDICFLKSSTPIIAHGFYPSVRLRKPSLSLLKDYLCGIDLLQKGDSKYFLNFKDLNASCFKSNGRLNAIILLDVKKGHCSQMIGSKKEAYRSLASSLSFSVQNKADAQETMHSVKLLIRELPIYNVSLSKDVKMNFEFLGNLINSLK
jgi:hypothetical protein